MRLRPSLLLALALVQTGAFAQAPTARPGRGYVFRDLHGSIPVGAVRGHYPGATQDVLFVFTNPTPDSTAFLAFQNGRLVQRLAIELPATYEFRSADIPSPEAGASPAARVYASFAFDGPQAAVQVLWNHNLNVWAFITGMKADGSRQGGGDLDWFGSAVTEAIYPQGGPEGGLPAQTYDRDTRRIDMTGGASLRVERASYRDVPDAYYTIGVYNGDVGPVQRMKGVAATSAVDLDTESAQSCSGLPAVADVNGDGYQDFWLCDSEGVNGFQSGAYRVFDPEAGLYVKDLRFSFLGLHVYDPATRTVREGKWATAGSYQTHNTYDLTSGSPVLIQQQVREPEREDCEGGSTCRSRFYTRVWTNGVMRVTEERLGTPEEHLPADFGSAQ